MLHLCIHDRGGRGGHWSYKTLFLMKTFNITFRPDPDNPDETVTITYEADSMEEAQGKFLNEYPDQAGEYRETHSPLSNYTEETKETEDKEATVEPNGLFERLFAKATIWAKLFTTLFVGLIGLGLVSSVLFGIDGGFGVAVSYTHLTLPTKS